jgi:hypothetical protein
MAGITIQKITVEQAQNPTTLPYANELAQKMFNVSGGLSASEYDFTTGVSYSSEERVINGATRTIWYVHDDKQNKISASSFFKHDEQGKNFSGYDGGNNMLALVQWLAGKKLTKTDRSANEWGAKFEQGQLVNQNVDLEEKRFYYTVA